MKTLILLRHAKSDWTGQEEDHDRPLNHRGRNDAPKMGNWISERLSPDQILCSTAVRTRETLQGSGLIAPTIFLRALYHASSNTLLENLHQVQSKVDTILMIGHNPGIAYFADMLLTHPSDDDSFQHFPTCACAIITFGVKDWSHVAFKTGTLTDFAIPRNLP